MRLDTIQISLQSEQCYDDGTQIPSLHFDIMSQSESESECGLQVEEPQIP